MSMRGMFRPGMRGYLVPLVAGIVLALSVFLPWVVVDGEVLRGVRDTEALWVAGLGVLASVLATLSLITRKNSRHPLLVIGLVALGLTTLAWRILPKAESERAQTVAQAYAIVDDEPTDVAPVTRVGSGIYLGLVSSAAIVVFGLTIVVRRRVTPYATVTPDDDVD